MTPAREQNIKTVTVRFPKSSRATALQDCLLSKSDVYNQSAKSNARDIEEHAVLTFI